MQYFTLPRLYVDQAFLAQKEITFDDGQTHYLKTVMRRQVGDFIRVFNGCEGEWLAKISELKKKSVRALLEKQLEKQPASEKEVHLIFSPLKKQRMDILIEKAVELGVTDLHPVLMARSDVRKVNERRVCAQILEAAEQCERFSIPKLHLMMDLRVKIQQWSEKVPLYACLERGGDRLIKKVKIKSHLAFVIGPAGGFEEREIQYFLKNSTVNAISLGKTVYRAETAAIICLVHARDS